MQKFDECYREQNDLAGFVNASGLARSNPFCRPVTTGEAFFVYRGNGGLPGGLTWHPC